MPHAWKVGDRVVHPAKPEWGAGVVRAVASHTQGGTRGQRLTIRFDGAGTKTLSTTIVDLQPAQASGSPPSHGTGHSPTLAGGETGRAAGDPAELPAMLAARGLPPAEVLRLAMPWYRFAPQGRGLLDWGIARIGVADPLSILPREQLAEAFAGFYRRLDFLVVEAAKDLRRRAPQEYSDLVGEAPPRMRALLAPDAGR